MQEHTGLTGPEFPGLQLPNGTPASPTWYQQYQKHALPSTLQGIEHPAGSGHYVDCNPARCWEPMEVCVLSYV